MLENFWKDKLSAQKILKEKKFIENIFNDFNSSVNELENLGQLLEIASKEDDTAVVKDFEKKIKENIETAIKIAKEIKQTVRVTST